MLQLFILGAFKKSGESKQRSFRAKQPSSSSPILTSMCCFLDSLPNLHRFPDRKTFLHRLLPPHTHTFSLVHQITEQALQSKISLAIGRDPCSLPAPWEKASCASPRALFVLTSNQVSLRMGNSGKCTAAAAN